MEGSWTSSHVEDFRRFTGAWRLDPSSVLPANDRDLPIDVDDGLTEPVAELIHHVLRVVTGAGFGGLGWFRYDPRRQEMMSYSMSRSGRLSVFPVTAAGRDLDFIADRARARLNLDETGTHLRLTCDRRQGEDWIPAGIWRAVRAPAGGAR